jgi:GAF domain-containing protein
MRRRSTGSGKQAKARRRKAETPKRGTAPTLRHRNSSAVGQESDFARLRRERDDALEQQAATSEVLRVISTSPGELDPVFQTILEKATRLCTAKFGFLWQIEDGNAKIVSKRGIPLALAEYLQRGPHRPPLNRLSPLTAISRVVQSRQTVHIADYRVDRSYLDRDPATVAAIELGGARTLLIVPMLKDDELMGAIGIYRQEVSPFTEKQITLVTNFAAQAVVAIENTRLLNELRQSLEQQTATADVLRVISSSPGELGPVFQAMLENATRLCEAKFGVLLLHEDGSFRQVAMHNAPAAYAELRQRQPVARPGPLTPQGRVAATKQVLHIPDFMEDIAYKQRDALTVWFVEATGARTLVTVPMLKEDELVGVIAIFRQEVRPFTDEQIALVTNFAAQAVIAIENTRLLNELRESLDRQTATSEVLSIISSSPGELEPVFQAMLENAVRICDARFGILFRYDNENFEAVALFGLPPAYAEFYRQRGSFQPPAGTPLDRLLGTKDVVRIVDDSTEPVPSTSAKLGSARSLIVVPMLKENALIGAISIFRQEVRSFTDKQISLLQNFAAQVVIAIENTRLLNELRQRTTDLTESLEQQTATSEVLKVISSSPGELQPVFEAMLQNAVLICGAKFGNIYRWDGDALQLVAAHNTPPAFIEARRRSPFRPSPTTPIGRLMATKAIVHVNDVAAERAYEQREPDMVAAVELTGVRTVLLVPMLKENELVGVLSVYRQEVCQFTDRQIALLQNFAAQAVIAIENARLLNELRQSLQQQTATADVLKVISRSTFDLKAVLNTLVESVARLCEADMAAIPRQAGAIFDHVATYGYSPGFHEFLQRNPITPGRGTGTGRAVLEGKTIHIPDVLEDPEYTFVEGQKVGGYRTSLYVPLMREGAAIGVLAIARKVARPFTDKQIELATTFADQAVIAIENVRLFEEIQDKSRQLEEASQHKSQFLANMSHELRTPLNAILGYTELMADGAYGEPSEKMLGILKRLEANGRHLLGLINDVLDLSKIEAGQLVLELSDYSVQDIAQTVRSTLEPLAADKKLAFKVDVAAQLPPGRGDGRRLTQVLINLVGNAIKFTDTGEVSIKAEANNGSFHVSVRDTGPGISAADQAKLFQEFQQADNAITRKKGGTGLGLAISKRIIEMHGGKIWVESQPGQGSTFTFSLPVIVERQVEAA